MTMTETLHFRYDESSGRITARYWGEEPPQRITDPPDGYAYAHEPDFSQDSRSEMMAEANAIHEPGEDFDPDTETSVGYLCYDDETGEIYPDAEIRESPDE